MTGETTPIGSIHVSPRAVARIAHQAALESYGVVGLAPKNLMNNLTNVQGVEVNYDGEKIIIDMYIVIEYGTRIKSVASSVANTVKYHVEKALGMPVTQVNIHVSGLRISNLN